MDTGLFRGFSFGSAADDVPNRAKDIRDVKVADLESFDAVVHLAALCNDPLGDLNPELTYAINHLASVHIAKMARDAGVRRFLYSSSCSLYGAAGEDDVLSEKAPMNPLTPYAVSKVRAEEDIEKLGDARFSPVFMRNATAYGVSSALRTDLVINNLMGWATSFGRIRIMSDGTPWRPVVHIEDIAEAFAAVLRAPRELVHGQAFNVGVNGENYRVRDLAEIVRATAPGCRVEYAAQGGPDRRSYRVDFSKLTTTITTFRPRWSVPAGAGEVYSAFRDPGLSAEEFDGGRYARLIQLSHLLKTGRLDSQLRWTSRASNDSR
jgi:nucleoside-diphosphate-sugar epimerase